MRGLAFKWKDGKRYAKYIEIKNNDGGGLYEYFYLAGRGNKYEYFYLVGRGNNITSQNITKYLELKKKYEAK